MPPESFAKKLLESCLWCDNEALFLCDAVLGMKAAVGPRGTVVFASLEEQEVWTCDAPMCLLHRHIIGFICGKDPATIDRCPYCARNEPHGGPMLREEADEIRRARHAEIRRGRMRAIG